MRIAFCSDIHGNAIALDAVLTDIAAQGGVDEYWVVGDLVAVGPQPLTVLERLTALPNVRFTRGNTDRYVTVGDRPPPYVDDVLADPARLPAFVEVAQTMAWTQGVLAATGWLPFFDDLPLEQRLTLPDGTRLLGVHGAPGTDGGRGLRPDYDDEFLHNQVRGCEAELVVVGHTHWPMNRRLGAVHAVNLGSVSNPQVPDLRAWYAILDANSNGYWLEHRAVAYDHMAVIAALEVARHPAPAFIARHMRGEFVRDWPLPPVNQ
ncbi:MAG: metallophosphoesterase family protein [Caldilineaceae bacterium]